MVRARLVRLTLVLCLTASTQGLLFAQGAFVANQDWIAETLCVNRDRPELDCDGVCEMTKRMNHHHEQEKERDVALVEIALGVHAAALETLDVPADGATDALSPLADSRVLGARDAVGEVFRPPRRA